MLKTKNIKFPHLLIIAIIASIFFDGCSSRRKVGQHHDDATMGPTLPEYNGMGPEPEQGFHSEDDAFVIVFGPGLARAMADVGVLKELEIARLPIKAVVGVETGALFSTIWSSSGQNSLEWQTHKLSKDTIVDYTFFGLKHKPAEGKKLTAFLDRALREPNLEKMHVATFVVSAADSGSERLRVDSKGSARDYLRGAMAVEGLMTPYEYEGVTRIAANTESPMPADYAKQLGIGKVLCVDAIGNPSTSPAKNQLERNYRNLMGAVAVSARREQKNCDETITINTDAVGFFEFEKKAEVVSQGRKAAREWIRKYLIEKGAVKDK